MQTKNFTFFDNGYGDALRHALFTALNANAFGKNAAIELGIAHEQSAPIVLARVCDGYK